MKKLIAILLLLALLLCGCGKSDKDRFVKLCEGPSFWVIVDTETGVEYSVSSGAFNEGTVTMLYDSYGNPYIYPAFDAREDRLP